MLAAELRYAGWYLAFYAASLIALVVTLGVGAAHHLSAGSEAAMMAVFLVVTGYVALNLQRRSDRVRAGAPVRRARYIPVIIPLAWAGFYLFSVVTAIPALLRSGWSGMPKPFIAECMLTLWLILIVLGQWLNRRSYGPHATSAAPITS